MTQVFKVRRKLRNVGNSAALILPKVLLDSLGLSVGDEVQISLYGNRFEITPAAKVPLLEVEKLA